MGRKLLLDCRDVIKMVGCSDGLDYDLIAGISCGPSFYLPDLKKVRTVTGEN